MKSEEAAEHPPTVVPVLGTTVRQFEEEEASGVEGFDQQEKFNSNKIKLEGYVHYPIGLWDTFNEESKRYFLKRYYGKNLRRCEFSKVDFKILYTIHVGKFSRVVLTKWKRSKYVVVKLREKKSIVQNRLLSQTKREIRLLNFMKFPFVMTACIVQCNVYLYYIMNFACGNSLKQLTQTRILSENQAKFYCSQLALALEFLHSVGIIHRGVEAGNVLICHDGYVKLGGFSKAKIGLGKYRSFENFERLYSVPDILNEKHGHLYDLWCFGALIYFLCSSENPYSDPLGRTTMENKAVKTPEYFSPELTDITSRLLDYDRCSRLGAKCPAEIRQHSWFDIPWHDIENKRVKPPLLPRCLNPVHHFHTFPTLPLEEASYDPFQSLFADCFSNH